MLQNSPIQTDNNEPVVTIEKDFVTKKYKYAKREYEVINILQNHVGNNWRTPEIVNYDLNQFIMKKCEGKPIDWRRSQAAFLFEKMKMTGSLLGQLHNILDNRMDKLLRHQKSSLKNYLLTKFDDYLNNYGGVYLQNEQRKIIKSGFLNLLNKINPVSEYGFVHGDFCYQNILYGNELNYLIDYENSYIGYQIDDLSRFSSKIILLGVEIKYLPVDKLEKHFLDGYLKIRPIDFGTYDLLKFVYLFNIKKPLEILFNSPHSIIRKGNNRRKYRKLINIRYKELLKKLDTEKPSQ